MNAPMAAQLHTNGQYGHAQTTGIADVHREQYKHPIRQNLAKGGKHEEEGVGPIETIG